MKLRIILAITGLLITQSVIAHGNLADVVAAGNSGHALEMLDTGTDPNVSQADGTTALMYAAYQGDTVLAKALLEAGANPDVSNDYGTSAIHEAAINGSVELIEVMLEQGADPNWTNPEGETPLMVVARAGNVPAAELLLKHGADLHARENWGGQTAIMWAAAKSQPDMLRFLIASGADINQHARPRLWDRRITSEPRPKDMNKGGFSPVQYAAREGCIECLEILAAAGADLDAIDPDGVTALNLALINLHFDAAAVLIEAGADVNKWDLFGRAPLYNALDLHTLPVGGRADIPSGDKLTGYDIAVMLLERGANPNMQLKLRPPYRNAVFDRGGDNTLSTGATPLLRAARAADIPSVKLLLEYDALVDLPNAQGHTPLMIAAGVAYPSAPTRGRFKTEADSIETIQILLNAGADINALTGNPARRPEMDNVISDRGAGMQPAIRGAGPTIGRTALHGAAKQGWTDIARFLIDNGAIQQVADSEGRTPFDLAMGRYPPAFLDSPPEPFVDTAMLLQEKCLADDSCNMKNPVNFSNPDEIK